MRTATIDYQDGTFHVTVEDQGRVIGLHSGAYKAAIDFATEHAVPRIEVTLTHATQVALFGEVTGGQS